MLDFFLGALPDSITVAISACPFPAIWERLRLFHWLELVLQAEFREGTVVDVAGITVRATEHSVPNGVFRRAFASRYGVWRAIVGVDLVVAG